MYLLPTACREAQQTRRHKSSNTRSIQVEYATENLSASPRSGAMSSHHYFMRTAGTTCGHAMPSIHAVQSLGNTTASGAEQRLGSRLHHNQRGYYPSGQDEQSEEVGPREVADIQRREHRDSSSAAAVLECATSGQQGEEGGGEEPIFPPLLVFVRAGCSACQRPQRVARRSCVFSLSILYPPVSIKSRDTRRRATFQ